MTLSDAKKQLNNKLKHYPVDSARGGDTYDNGIHVGLEMAIKIINRIDKKPLSLKRKFDYHNANPKYKDR